MYQKDYILRLIEEFSKVLGVMLGFKLDGDYKKAEEVIDEALKKFTATDLNWLMSVEDKELLHELLERKKLNAEQVHIIAELLFQQAEINKANGKDKNAELCKRSLFLFEWVQEHQQKSFSVEIAKRVDLLRTIVYPV